MKKALTARELKKQCEMLILLGGGDKEIYVATDNDGTDFHPLLFGFTSGEKEAKIVLEKRNEDTSKKVVLLG